MNKYKSRENRFFQLQEILRELEAEVLVIHSKTGQPFVGQVLGFNRYYDVNGKLNQHYWLWIEEIGVHVNTKETEYYVISTGFF